jgi:amino acid adenylation domain-containing protein
MGHDSVQEMFSRAAERFGTNTAIEQMGERITYGELESRANNLANFLIASGAAPNSTVAIMAESRAEIITSMLGILKARCVFVPLDPTLPENRLQMMVAEVSPKWFITQSGLYSKTGKIVGDDGTKASVICVDDGEVNDDCCDRLVRASDYAAFSDTTTPSVGAEPDDPCYVYFTSGSTGRPKAILGRTKGLGHYIRWEIKTFGVQEGTRVSQFITPVFDPFLRDVFVPLCAGGVVCVPDGKDTILRAAKLIDWIDIQQINLIHCVPFLFRLMINEALSPYYFSSLKYILLAGEPLAPSDVKKWMDVFGKRIELVNIYGPTETTLAKFFHPIKPSDAYKQAIPVGKPIDGAAALIVADDGTLCGPGSVGEVYIQTAYRSLGYYNQPEQTKEVFIVNPFSDDPDDIVYKTGDLGRILPDGGLDLLGRKDSQVKIRGVRIELHEIENLLRQHEAVRDVAVVDREDPSGQKYLCAYIVVNGGADTGAIRDYLSTHLPEYMMPSAFVALKTLPRLPSGKINRKALPAPGDDCSALRLYVPPRTPVEEELVRIWQEILGVRRVGVFDSFFELGGHSLSIIQLASRIWDGFQVELPLEVLFDNPTIVHMTSAIVSAQAAQGDLPGVAQLLAELKQLSPDEIKAMLAQEESS